MFFWNVLGMRRRLGLPTAIRLAWLFSRSHSSNELIAVRIHGLKGPIWLRPNSSDIETFLQVFAEGQYDFARFPQQQKVWDEYRAALKRGETPLIVDCGANIGLSAVWFANLFPEARIVAVEPAADNIDLMRRNLAAYPNAEIVAGGVWDRQTQLSIVDRNVLPWAYQVDDQGPGETGGVQSHTIAEIAGDRPILVMKVDIEGSESALFRSNTGWLDKTGLLIIELHDEKLPGQKTSRNFFQRIAKNNFEFAISGENALFFISGNAA